MVDMYVSVLGAVHHVDDGVLQAPSLRVRHDSFDSNVTLKIISK